MAQVRDILLDVKKIDSIESNVAQIQTDLINFDALPDQTGQTGKYLTTNGNDAAWSTISQYTPPTNQGSGNFLAGDGTYKQVTVPTLVSQLSNDSGFQTLSQVNAAFANLIDSSPTTLDTLNELAAALGDDPNFATTLSGQIGAKWTQDNSKISNWDAAYSWGDHSGAGYVLSSNLASSLSLKANLTGATFTGAITATSFSGDGHNLTNLDWTQIGNTPSSISTRNAYTASTGDTVFAATYTLGSVEVYLNGMHLMKDVDYTASNGTSITLTDPAAAGDEIEIIGFSTFNLVNVYNKTETDALITTVNNNLATKANQSTTYTKTEVDTSLALKANLTDLTPTNVSDKNNASTGYFSLPRGTTAQRPINPTAGYTRYNTDLGSPEWWHDTSGSWIKYSQGIPYAIDILSVAGGGGGGAGYYGGGGGAGGLSYVSNVTISSGGTLNITVGSGGAKSSDIYLQGSDGTSSSVIFNGTTLISSVGGGGAGSRNLSSGGNAAGRAGGSGGGASWPYSSGGSGTNGQGYSGTSTGANQYGGGGGGAGGTGTTNGEPLLGGSGGIGSNAYSTWASATSSGESGYFAGGGGAGTRSGGAAVSVGGLGGGGDAGVQGGRQPEAGYANMGGGGGGADTGDNNSPTDPHYCGANGGSGIVIIRYSGAQKGLGGTVYNSGGYTYHKFTSSGTYTA